MKDEVWRMRFGADLVVIQELLHSVKKGVKENDFWLTPMFCSLESRCECSEEFEDSFSSFYPPDLDLGFLGCCPEFRQRHDRKTEGGRKKEYSCPSPVTVLTTNSMSVSFAWVSFPCVVFRHHENRSRVRDWLFCLFSLKSIGRLGLSALKTITTAVHFSVSR